MGWGEGSETIEGMKGKAKNIVDKIIQKTQKRFRHKTEVQTENIEAVGREILTVGAAENGDPAVTLVVHTKNIPLAGSVTVYKVVNGIMTDEVTSFTVTENDITFSNPAAPAEPVIEDGEKVMVFYSYAVTGENVSKITFSGNAFPATYKVVGDTIVRGEDGQDRKMQFFIPKAKLQSGFSLTMDAENVSTFDFNLEILTDTGTNRLYDIFRL